MAWKVSSLSHQMCVQHLLRTWSLDAEHIMVIKVDIVPAPSVCPVMKELLLLPTHSSLPGNYRCMNYLRKMSVWLAFPG